MDGNFASELSGRACLEIVWCWDGKSFHNGDGLSTKAI